MSIALTLKELQLCPSSPRILDVIAEENDSLASRAQDAGLPYEAYAIRAAELRAEAQRLRNANA